MSSLVKRVLCALVPLFALFALMSLGALAYSLPWWGCFLTTFFVGLTSYYALSAYVSHAWGEGVKLGFEQGHAHAVGMVTLTGQLDESAIAAARRAGYRVGVESGYVTGAAEAFTMAVNTGLLGVARMDKIASADRSVSESGSRP